MANLRLLFGRFNPRPREGATSAWAALRIVHYVSIRAPVRGRRFYRAPQQTHTCFNPRPREGATWRSQSPPAVDLGFNPRPREGATSPPEM